LCVGPELARCHTRCVYLLSVAPFVSPTHKRTEVLEAMARIDPSQPNEAMARVAPRRNGTISLGQSCRVKVSKQGSLICSLD
jgi:hypothetical protein